MVTHLKRYISIILAAIMLLSLTSCFTKTSEPHLPAEESSLTETMSPATEASETDLPTSYENTETDPNRKRYNIGNCLKLVGDIDVYLFFMDDDNSTWTPSHAKAFTNNEIKPALSYLEREAKKWGKYLHFNTPKINVTGVGEFTMKYSGTVTDGDGDSSTDVLYQAASCIGYGSDDELLAQYRNETGRDNAVFLTIFDKDGRSYAIQTQSKDSMTMEHCVLFSEPWMYKYGLVLVHSSCIAHEILHLYGADDYYKEPRAAISAEVYPDDIMLKTPPNLSECSIGDYTAFSVGWTDTVPDVCSREGWLD